MHYLQLVNSFFFTKYTKQIINNKFIHKVITIKLEIKDENIDKKYVSIT